MTTNLTKLNQILANQSRFLWFTDVHMKSSNIDRCRELFSFILNTAVEKEIKTLIFTGDMFDGKDNISVKCMSLLRKFILNLRGNAISMIMVPGNHDYSETIRIGHYESDSIPEHSLSLFDNFEHVSVIEDNTCSGDFVFVPYRGVNSVMLGDINSHGSNKYLFAHEGIIGADLGNGHLDSFSLPVKHFKKFKRVFMGHYHRFHTIENITYLGSPFTQNYGEANQNKFIGIIDFDKDNISYIETPLGQHKVIHITEENSDATADDGEYTRIIVEGGKKFVTSMNKKLNKELEKSKIILKVTDSKRARMNIGETMSRGKMAEVYLNNMKTDLDKDKLLEMTKKFIEESEDAAVSV